MADWLRDDGAWARSFAFGDEAERIDARGGDHPPTLVEDPESAELVDPLPDIVDAARSAADTIAPATTRDWTDADRGRLEGNLLDILRNAAEFERRVSPPAT